MRAMRISLGIFLVVLVLVVLGAFGVGRVREQLAADLAALPEEAGEAAVAAVEAMMGEWRAARWWLWLSLHRTQFRAVEERLEELLTAAAMGEEAQVEYVLAWRRLALAVEEMGEIGFVF